jgi:nucleoside-diphosphate-sugar epimerase
VLPDRGEGASNVVYVDDVIDAMLLAATRAEAVGERFLISGPAPITWAEFYEGMAEAIGAGGPEYVPADAIAGDAGIMPRVVGLLSDPVRVLRTLWQVPQGRKLLELCLRALPETARDTAQRQLTLPQARWRHFRHLPDRKFMQSRATISTDQARRLLGYEPKFDFAAGMRPTALYLQQKARLSS